MSIMRKNSRHVEVIVSFFGVAVILVAILVIKNQNIISSIIVLSIGFGAVMFRMFSCNYVRHVIIKNGYIIVYYYRNIFALQSFKSKIADIHWSYGEVHVGIVSKAFELKGECSSSGETFVFTDRYFMWSNSSMEDIVYRLNESGAGIVKSAKSQKL